MIFAPEVETWMRVIPLPGATIMEVIKKYTETIKFCSMRDGYGGQRRKGIFFVFNKVTILRTYAEYTSYRSDEDFMGDIEKEYHKNIRTAVL